MPPRIEVLRRTNAGAKLHPFLDELGGVLTSWPAGAHHIQRVAQDWLRDGNPANESLKGHQIRARHGSRKRGVLNGRRGPHDVELLVFGWMLDDDMKHEAVELGFGQRVRAFELNRVLGRKDEERLFERVGAPLDRDAVLLHRFEQCGLGLRRRSVDFVRQQNVAEHRTRRKHHRPPARCRVFLNDVRAGDVRRHQVWRELDAREFQIQHARHRVNQQRLGQTRNAHDDAVATDKQRQKNLIDDVFLTNDDLAQLGNDGVTACLHAVCERNVVGRF